MDENKTNPHWVDRRTFLKATGAAGLGVAMTNLGFPAWLKAAPNDWGVTLEDLKSKLTHLPVNKRFCDWYFSVSFDHEGEHYILNSSITSPGLSGKYHAMVYGARGPFNIRKEAARDVKEAEKGLVREDGHAASVKGKTISIVDDPEWDVRKKFFKTEADFKEEIKGDSVVIHLGDSLTSLNSKGCKLRLNEKDCKLNLDCTARGPAMWYGNEPNQGFNLTENLLTTGIEAHFDVEGSAVIDNETLKIKGRGNLEHVWIEVTDPSWFMKMTCVDFIIMHFDEAYAFLFKDVGQNGKLYNTGAIYLIGDQKMLPVTELNVKYKDWAYAPSAYRFIPTAYEVVAETEAGLLKAFMEPLVPPSWYHHRRMEEFTMNHINGWQFSYWTGETKIKGSFNFRNGRSLKLTNGIGRNEPQRVSPLA